MLKVVLLGGLVFYGVILISSAKKGGGGSKCGAIFNQTTAGISLSNHNLTNGSCEWHIWPVMPPKSPPLKVIQLFFRTVFLHKDDTIKLYKSEAEAANDTNPIWGPIGAQNGSLTIITEEKNLTVKIEGTDETFMRTLEMTYQTNDGSIGLSPDVNILHSPKCVNVNVSSNCKVQYIWNYDPHIREIPSFSMEFFNFSTSSLELEGSTANSPYNPNPSIDFFPAAVGTPLKITVKMQKDSECYRMRIHFVDKECSGLKKLDGLATYNFKSPAEELNNGSIITDCRMVFEQPTPSNVLGLEIGEVHFADVMDILAVNDGGSVLSTPLIQVTTSNINHSRSQVVRTNGTYMWIGFKPISYASTISVNISTHGQGGYFKENAGSANIITMHNTVGNDTVFLLEVADDKIVYLNFSDSSFPSPAMLSVYDGFDTSNLLTTLHGNVWYPVISRSNKMMLIARNFHSGAFTAEFKGTDKDLNPGCLHMSSFTNENYALSGNCNETCMWVIPPQDHPGSDLLLDIQFLSLKKGDQVSIVQLDDKKTRLGDFGDNATHVPRVVLPAQEGALVEVTRGPCDKADQDTVVVVGHSSYVPACNRDMTLTPLESFRLTSPGHPDTYPVFSKCVWKLNVAKDSLVHMAFDSMNLAPNHCLRITQDGNNTRTFSGNELSEDLLVKGNSLVEFDASNCGKAKVADALVSNSGFVINGSVADCGDNLKDNSGSFSVPPNKTLCFWKVSVKETSDNADDVVNIISYTVTEKDADKKNYEFVVYDGNSVRDKVIENTTAGIWSRTNTLIFIYRRINTSKPSATIDVKYETVGCNASMQCDNKICLHPDWRCNGINECGDFSDERNCQAIPIPPKVETTGYSPVTFWLTLVAMICLGVALGVAVPYFYQRYKSGYRRFGDISIIE